MRTTSFNGAVSVAAVAAVAVAAVPVAHAAVAVTHTVDRAAPEGALPKQTIEVRGLVRRASYRLTYTLSGSRSGRCTRIGSSIVIRASRRGRAVFRGLPGGSYDSATYRGFCPRRVYRGALIREIGRRTVVVKRWTFTGAPTSSGASAPQPTSTPTGGSDAGASVTFRDDPAAPAGSVPAKIARLTGLRAGSSYFLSLKSRTSGTDCFTQGYSAQNIADETGSYEAKVPTPVYGQGYDLCPETVYDVTLGRWDGNEEVPLFRSTFTSGSVR